MTQYWWWYLLGSSPDLLLIQCTETAVPMMWSWCVRLRLLALGRGTLGWRIHFFLHTKRTSQELYSNPYLNFEKQLHLRVKLGFQTHEHVSCLWWDKFLNILSKFLPNSIKVGSKLWSWKEETIRSEMINATH